jgi:meso-butanediol dehydrogenase / (S,S)-butanediol dehydrogenase / diacetyl reductase
MRRLNGKVILITGTGGEQGRAAALLFAKEGARVVGCDVNKSAASQTLTMVRDAGGEMVSMAPVDLSIESGAARWVEEGAAAFGGIDVLYNNASAPRFGLLDPMPVEDWHFTMRNELDIVYFVTCAAWPHLVARGGGSIISTASIAAVRGCVAPQSAHGAAKAAVTSLMTSLVIEGAPHKIRANTISPGPIEHPLRQSALADPNHPMSKLVAKIPMGRMGRPQEVAYLALFLASDESSFITGANVVIDGGLTTWV